MNEIIGNCHICGEAVWAAPGQAVKWLVKTAKNAVTGEVVSTERLASHKKCRKLSTKQQLTEA